MAWRNNRQYSYIKQRKKRKSAEKAKRNQRGSNNAAGISSSSS